MSINGIGYHHYQNNTAAMRYPKTSAESFPFPGDSKEQTRAERNTSNTNAQEMKRAKYSVRDVELEKEEKENDSDQDKTDTEIIVKPDGSKIMMTRVWVGGAETVMSMEIAKPTNILEGDLGRTVEESNLMISDTSEAIESAPEK